MQPTTTNIKTKVLAALLTIAALAAGQTAWADNINISADATDLAMTDGNTYTVTATNVTITNRITVEGTVELVLGTGTTLHAPKGIQVSEGNTLTISGTGALTIDETAYKYAGIGVSDQGNCGTVTITGGVINIQGGSNAYGIGTAGSSSARCGDITITGGQVTVTAGNFSGDRYYAIGGLYGYGSLTLDWTNTTDYIILNNGCYGLASFSLVDGKELYIEAENGGNNLIAT